MKLLLFDIDGTLLLSHGGSLRAMTRAARRVFTPSFEIEPIDRNGRLDPEIVALALRWNRVEADPEQVSRFRRFYLQELEAEVPNMRPLPGVLPLLERLRGEQGVMLGIVTGNYSEVARLKLQAAGIAPDWFTANAYGEEAPIRAELVGLATERAGRRHGVAIDRDCVLVIGDTPRDVACAHQYGCRCVAVCTGSYSAEALAAAGADLVLPGFVHAAPLWSLLAEAD